MELNIQTMLSLAVIDRTGHSCSVGHNTSSFMHLETLLWLWKSIFLLLLLSLFIFSLGTL